MQVSALLHLHEHSLVLWGNLKLNTPAVPANAVISQIIVQKRGLVNQDKKQNKPNIASSRKR